MSFLYCFKRLLVAWETCCFLTLFYQSGVDIQANLSLHGKSKQAAASPLSKVMPQPNGQPASTAQAAVRGQMLTVHDRHVMPCSSRSPPPAAAQPQQAKTGIPAQLVQPLFPATQGREHLCKGTGQGAEQGLGFGFGRGSDSRVASVRYSLSSSKPAVGAGIWEEQTTRFAVILHSHLICTVTMNVTHQLLPGNWHVFE